MNEFDHKAAEWDKNKMHWERSEAIAKNLLKTIPEKKEQKALEYGAGTGILSFLLAGYFSEITLMDSSPEMVKVMKEKVAEGRYKNLKPLLFDLEKADFHGTGFDYIFTQMVLHHVQEITVILKKFYHLINPGGILAVADLYKEDGSFHDEDFSGHQGFDVVSLQSDLEKIGFIHRFTEECYIIKKQKETGIREYPVFLMVVSKDQFAAL